MKLLTFLKNGRTGLGIVTQQGEIRGLLETDPAYPGDLKSLLAQPGALESAAATLSAAPVVDPQEVRFAPPLPNPDKIICIGLNYADHSAESGFEKPAYPTVFSRFASSLVGHNTALLRPTSSPMFDFEGEMVAIVGRGGRHIARADALGHIAGYSIFNDASVRDYQLRTPQWTLGKNFDATGAFGPYFVSSDELPAGARGLKLATRLNGTVVQSANTDDLIFDVAELVATISEAITLAPGDVIVTGTPAGVGHARKPPLYMNAGDLCEVEIEGLGTLSNPVADEMRAAA